MASTVDKLGSATVEKLDAARAERSAIVSDFTAVLAGFAKPDRLVALRGIFRAPSAVKIPTLHVEYNGSREYVTGGIDFSGNTPLVRLTDAKGNAMNFQVGIFADVYGLARNTPKDLEAAFIAIIEDVKAQIPADARAARAT
jgi:hypothetical protein